MSKAVFLNDFLIKPPFIRIGIPNMVNDKAKKELNHEYRPLKDTITEFYSWQKERGVIK